MKRKHKPVLFVCLLIFVVVAAGLGTFLIRKYMPSKEQMDLYEYYGVTGDEAAIILGTDILDSRGILWEGEGYLPIEVVSNRLNKRYYWDKENQQVLYATPSELTAAPAASQGGGDVWLKDGKVYLSISYIKKYTDIDSYIYQDPDRIAIQYQFSDVNMAEVKKDTSVRYRGGIKSEVLTQAEKGESLIVLEELENWSQVATQDGYIGYVQKKRITAPETVTVDRDFQREEYSYYSMEEPVNLVWHQVTNTDANGGLGDTLANVTGVNVISPTWFSIRDNSGNISNIASADYVALAHERNIQVWGLVDNFSVDISTTEVLSKTSSRQNLIRQLIDAALAVDLDGINVDFETLSEDAGVHFLEFLRELAIECRKNNLVISVDNPVPAAFTSHYDRGEQGDIVDYVIIMGYDEHYVGSEQAGSVASLPWVEQGIQDTLKEVPAQRVINAIPFYTRLWKTANGQVTSEAIGMNQAQETISAHNVETYWDKEAGQNYGTYESEGATYQIWLEDAQSIAAKVMLVPKYELAGVAAWSFGFEDSSIWQVITDNLQ
ncbi:MAG TPA: SH3 domain-containing protein [Candidatus Blautia faecigallinarum]|uniref:SH3 domain-containing protein n=1 Tax=Candidatus Blautia faecigallinarum TaxID=2838488 RepID=A0A9D2DSZ2_9FIRM|nr:SH3 domain-containing protein [Candidatus Blautia faecigallinarum]